MGPLSILETTSTSVTLSWNPPLDLGGGSFRGYTIEAHEINICDGSTLRILCFLAPPQCRVFTINSLRPNRFYKFKVYSENEDAMSEQALVLKKPLRLKSTLEKPSAPTQPAIIHDDDGDILLQWRPSSSDGTDSVVSYIIERKDVLSDRWVRINSDRVNATLYKPRNLRSDVQYQFRVSAENSAGISSASDCSDLTTVKSSFNRVAPSIEVGLVDVEVAEGDEASFTVVVRPSAKFVWYLDKFELKTCERIRIMSTETVSTLTLTSVELDDDGEILCRVGNDVRYVTTSAKLVVETPPKVTLPRMYEEGLNYDRGETIRLKFPVIGKPQPRIHWTVDGRDVVVDQTHEMRAEEHFVIIRITDASKSDAGIYALKAENHLGSDVAQLKLVMTDVPNPPIDLHVTSDNSTCVLNWSPPNYDGGCPIEKYVIEQKQVGRSAWVPIRTVSSVTSVSLSHETLSAFEEDLENVKEYIFRVKAVNEFGTSEPSVEFEVARHQNTGTNRDPDPTQGEAQNLATESQSSSAVLREASDEDDLSQLSFTDSDESESSESAEIMLTQNSSTTATEKKPRLVVKSKESSGTPRTRRSTTRNAAFSPTTYSFLEMGNEVEFRNRFRVCEKIGRGAFTVVHRCYNKKSRQQFAARFIRIGRDMGTKEMVHRELEIMYLCQHEKLVTFYEAYDLGSYVVMVLEYIPSGELSDRIVRDDPRMTEEDCRVITRQICEGIAYLHRNNIVHLDLKPENILCMANDTNEVKLIDFGLARRLDQDASVRMLFATPEFCAPEVVNYETVGYPTDMWSIGVLAFVMLSGTSPFLGDDDDETLSNVSEATWDFQEECWENISTEAKDFVSCLLLKSKERRMTIQDALRHPWIQGRKCLFDSSTTGYVQHLQPKENDVYRTPKQDVCWKLTTRKK